jgi:hypothetical protein
VKTKPVATLPLTPGPLNVPPAGVAVSGTVGNAGAPATGKQYADSSKGVMMAAGGGVPTVTRRVSEVVQRPVLMNV